MKMIRLDINFQRDECLTPDIAAALAQLTEHYRAKLLLECDGKRVLMDSLIGILSLDCVLGTPLGIIAEGEDALPAARAAADLLEGRGELGARR